jgi:hypothetical protein
MVWIGRFIARELKATDSLVVVGPQTAIEKFKRNPLGHDHQPDSAAK